MKHRHWYQDGAFVHDHNKDEPHTHWGTDSRFELVFESHKHCDVCHWPLDAQGVDHHHPKKQDKPPRPDVEWVTPIPAYDWGPFPPAFSRQRTPQEGTKMPPPPKVVIEVHPDIAKEVQRFADDRETLRRLDKGKCPTCLGHAVSRPINHEGGCAVYDRT